MIALCTCEHPAATVVAGVPVHAIAFDDAVTRVVRMASCPGSHVVHNIASDPIVRAADEPDLRRALQEADLNLPDGTPVVWAARILGPPGRARAERVYGPQFLLAVAGVGAVDSTERPLRHAFVGGTGPMLDALTGQLLGRFPSLEVVATYPPPVRAVTSEGVAEDVACLRERANAPVDVLWVGLGTPKQHLWASHARGHDVARVIVTVGAAFDFLSGAKRQAPSWLGPMGLEWVFRLASEPRRLWRRYLLGNPRFVLAVGHQWVGLRTSRRP